MDRKKVTEILLNSGAWSFIRQRPYGVLADPDITPKSIYVSTYASAPLDVDFDFLLKNNKEDFQNGIDVLNHLVDDQVKLAIDNSFSGFFEKIKGVEFLSVNGPHPAGNVECAHTQTQSNKYG